ncbi:MAG: hypothetical protein ACK2U0_04645 [Candidatus Promineifilaceae bacterium]
MKESEQELLDKVNIETIMQEIRQQVLERKLPSQATLPIKGDRLPPEFYEHLYKAILAQNELEVKMQIVKSDLPIVGGLVDHVRTMFHQLVIYYVQQLTEQQKEVNRHLLGVLTAISQYFEEEGEE